MTDVHFKASDKVGAHARKSMGIPKEFERRERLPNEALPNVINKMAGDYEPQPMEPVRPGANDHRKYKSRGM